MKSKICVECHGEFTKKQIQRIKNNGKKQWMCVFCKRKRRDKRRKKIFNTILRIRRSSEEVRAEKRKRIILPVLPSIKSARPKKRVSVLGIYLTRVEKTILFKKYCSNGLNPQDADKKVKERVEFLRELIQKLRAEKKSEQEINKKFKEEFAKLCESG